MASSTELREKIRWMQLALTPRVGPVTFWRCLRKAQGDIEAACTLVEDLASEEVAEQELLEHDRRGFQVVLGADAALPKRLRQVRDSPILLSAVGNLSLLKRPCVAIVGARNASLQGKIFAAKLARELGECGVVVISGLARGIDAAAHEGSLETGSVAVLAGGLDVVYPAEHQNLYTSLAEKGVVLAEMRLGTSIEPSLFPRRNRIIAGLAQGVILIEAAAKSGSLITAQYALDNGREIFIVPGFPSDPRSAGGNALIKQGATLVESAADVLEVLKPKETRKEDETQVAQSPECSEMDENPSMARQEVLQALTTLPISIELLFQSQSCSLPYLLTILTELENEGKVQRHPNGDVSLAGFVG